MRQAFEGEQAYMLARDKRIRQKGYDAQKAGRPLESNPERDHADPTYSDKRQWAMGWHTAAAGEDPW